MSARYRTIALQAVGVAVCAAIVYLAFLRPNEPSPLSGITGPAALQQAQTQNPKGGNGKPSNRNRKSGRKPGARGGSADGGDGDSGPGAGFGWLPGGGVVAGNPGSPATQEPPTESNGGNPHTPPGSQYQDSVSRITSLLNQ